MDFTGLSLLDGSGITRLPLVGDFDASALADRLVSEWIPYFECHKCGRFDYCKFVQRRPNYPDQALDIKCGVVESSLRLFVEKTFQFLAALDPQQIQDYLDAAFQFEQFLWNAETMIGSYMDRPSVEYWSDLGPRYYGQIVRLRDNLNALAEKLCGIPDFKSERAVLLVEGWSEKAFLETLRESRMIPFVDILVDVYGGRGNRRPKRIEMVLERYARQGYKIFIQGDADGRDTGEFKEIVHRGAVTSERTFAFKYDFETAVPPALLHFSLQKLGELEGVERKEFVETVADGPRPIGECLRNAYELDLDPIKLDLAREIGAALNDPRVAWWRDEKFLETELGQFLQFLQRVF